MVVWTGQRLDFDALQRRLVNAPATIRRRLVVGEPASFVAFDVLAANGVRQLPWTEKRRELQTLAQGLQPPLQRSPVTRFLTEAEEWLSASSAAGVEGLVVKGASSRYHPGLREWVKVNSVGVVGGVRSIHVQNDVPGQVAVRRLAVVRDRCRG